MAGYTPTPNNAGTLRVLLGSVGGVDDSSGHMSSGSHTLNASWPPPLYAGFTPADVGCRITVMRAGLSGGLLITTVASYVSRTQITLTDAAHTTVDNDTGLVTIYRPVSTKAGTLGISMSLTSRDTFQFTVEYLPTDPILSKNVLPIVRQPVLVISTVAGVGDSYGAICGGTVDQVRKLNEPGSALTTADSGLVSAECQCITWDLLASKRIMAGRTWTSKLAGADIAKEIVEYGLGALSSSDECVGYDNGLVTDVTVDSFSVDDWQYVADNLDSLCQSISNGVDTYYWTTDAWRIVHLALQSTTSAPWAIDDRDGSAGNVLIQVACTTSREKYCNHAYVKASKELLPDIQKDAGQWGDGSKREFSTAFPVAALPPDYEYFILTQAYNSSKTAPSGALVPIPFADIGILNVTPDHTKKWYWTPNSNSVVQDTNEPVLRDQDIVWFQYMVSAERLGFSENASAVDETVNIEGLSGFYETVTPLDTVATEASVTALSASIAERFGVIPQTVDVMTYRGGLKPGQLAPIHLTAISAIGDFLIADVGMQTTADNLVIWTIKAIDGALIGDWLKALRDWANRTTASGGVVTAAGGPTIGGINVTADDPTITWMNLYNGMTGMISGQIYVPVTDLLIDHLRHIRVVAEWGTPVIQYPILDVERPESGVWDATIDYSGNIGFRPSTDETGTIWFFCTDETGSTTNPFYSKSFDVMATTIASVTALDANGIGSPDMSWVDGTTAKRAVVRFVAVGVSGLPLNLITWIKKGTGSEPKEWQGWDQASQDPGEATGTSIPLYVGAQRTDNGGIDITIPASQTTGAVFPPTDVDATWTFYVAPWSLALEASGVCPSSAKSCTFTMHKTGAPASTGITDAVIGPSVTLGPNSDGNMYFSIPISFKTPGMGPGGEPNCRGYAVTVQCVDASGNPAPDDQGGIEVIMAIPANDGSVYAPGPLLATFNPVNSVYTYMRYKVYAPGLDVGDSWNSGTQTLQSIAWNVGSAATSVSVNFGQPPPPVVTPLTSTTTLDPIAQTVSCDASGAGFFVNLPPFSQWLGIEIVIVKVDSTSNPVTWVTSGVTDVVLGLGTQGSLTIPGQSVGITAISHTP